MTQKPAAQNPVMPTDETPPAPKSGKHRVYNLIILDESGSMESIKKATINGFNETLQTIQHTEREYTDQQHFVAFVPFSICRPLDRFDLQTTATLQLLDEQTYRPNCGTPLYDAIGFGISKLSEAISQQGGTYTVLVTILTDGEENSSTVYKGPQIKTMIETLKPLGWTFTYIGANHDVERVADSLSILHRTRFEADDVGTASLWNKESKRRINFMAKIDVSRSEGKPLTDADADYFSDDESN